MCKKILKIAFLLLAFSITMVNCPNCKNITKAEDNLPNINAKASYLLEARTGVEILSNNADQRLPIASMTKLATLSVIFSEIDKGNLSLDDKVTISQNAADTEGSQAFLDAGSSYLVADLIKTIVMVSANDSCVALSEHIYGSEQIFAKKMNELVSSLNLQNTNFENSTGLPSTNHYSSAKDIAKIYQTVCDNPTYIKYSKIWMEDLVHPSGRKTGLVNTNRLIKTYDGCDSGKTGHTEEAKYCLTASASRAGTRLIAVVIGSPDSKTRFEEVKTMFNYGFANYQSVPIISSELPLQLVNVKGARHSQIEAYAKEDYIAFIKKGDNSSFNTHIVADEDLKAPIKAGQKIGTVLILDQNNIVVEEVDLVAKQDILKIKLSEILEKIYNKW